MIVLLGVKLQNSEKLLALMRKYGFSDIGFQSKSLAQIPNEKLVDDQICDQKRKRKFHHFCQSCW
jgi:hypothetical protein